MDPMVIQLPLNGERITTKFELHRKAAQIEGVKLIVRHSCANLGAGHCRLIGEQSGCRGLDHDECGQLNGN
jgi:hypothetical protein